MWLVQSTLCQLHHQMLGGGSFMFLRAACLAGFVRLLVYPNVLTSRESEAVSVHDVILVSSVLQAGPAVSKLACVCMHCSIPPVI